MEACPDFPVVQCCHVEPTRIPSFSFASVGHHTSGRDVQWRPAKPDTNTTVGANAYVRLKNTTKRFSAARSRLWPFSRTILYTCTAISQSPFSHFERMLLVVHGQIATDNRASMGAGNDGTQTPRQQPPPHFDMVSMLPSLV